jgi:II/X family phage/plasmid replication protein
MKIYDKAAELKRHPLSESVNEEARTALEAYAQDTLRVEVTIRSMELKKRGLDRIEAWTPAIGEAILDERISKLTALEGLRMTDEEVNELPRSLLAPYELWRAGHDLRTKYSRAQFYRYRAALLGHGVDISHVRPRVATQERAYAIGRPLKDFITGPGLEPPEGDAVRVLGMFGT